jgi:hypothetical protein
MVKIKAKQFSPSFSSPHSALHVICTIHRSTWIVPCTYFNTGFCSTTKRTLMYNMYYIIYCNYCSLQLIFYSSFLIQHKQYALYYFYSWYPCSQFLLQISSLSSNFPVIILKSYYSLMIQYALSDGNFVTLFLWSFLQWFSTSNFLVQIIGSIFSPR